MTVDSLNLRADFGDTRLPFTGAVNPLPLWFVVVAEKRFPIHLHNRHLPANQDDFLVCEMSPPDRHNDGKKAYYLPNLI